ncbi:MAG: hypothetical protein HGA45_27015 [Chloroflexales bacterium]|nr:hypothetical protein [Chloroflexales bacterium]
MSRYPKRHEHLLEEAETDALAAAAILADLTPLVHCATSRADPYSLERLQRIAHAAEQLRQRAIARRPRASAPA